MLPGPCKIEWDRYALHYAAQCTYCQVYVLLGPCVIEWNISCITLCIVLCMTLCIALCIMIRITTYILRLMHAAGTPLCMLPGPCGTQWDPIMHATGTLRDPTGPNGTWRGEKKKRRGARLFCTARPSHSRITTLRSHSFALRSRHGQGTRFPGWG